ARLGAGADLQLADPVAARRTHRRAADPAQSLDSGIAALSARERARSPGARGDEPIRRDRRRGALRARGREGREEPVDAALPPAACGILCLLGAPPGGLLISRNRWIPESPRYLLARGREARARAVMNR